MGAHLLESCSSRKGAQFTLVAPTSASITATLGFGDHVTVGRRKLAHCLQDFSETRSLAGIDTVCSGGADLEAVVTITSVTADGIHTAAIGADAGLGTTFVFIHTALAIGAPLHARGADTHEGADQVLAHHALGLTVV